MSSNELVLVTGGSGFLGIWCIIHALNAGYAVRTTIRSKSKEGIVREMLKNAETTNVDKLSIVEADLGKDDGWKEAVEGCTYVLHVASPFPAAPPKHEDELIIPAREGTLRIVKAARDAGVKRVVLTSSFAAIGYGQPPQTEAFTEKNWTNSESPEISPYVKSKTLAERSAWDFIEKEGGSLELSVVNPVGIFGPVLGKDYSPSIEVVYRLINGTMPGCPRLEFGIVDVRDTADLHILAMTRPEAKGERFLACSPPPMTMQEISLALREKLGQVARHAPTRNLPSFLVRFMALFDPAVASVIGDLDKRRSMSNEKAKTILGWEPCSNVDALVATAESLMKHGLVKK